MNERKIRILEAVIREYINTGEPVGSRTLSKKYELGVSSATIRNEMADLEELGYLENLHSSSGRVPSDKGYRFYVDQLMKYNQLTPQEEIMISSEMVPTTIYQLDKLVREATVVLSRLTNLVTMVQTPSVQRSCIKRIQLVPLDEHNIMSVIVTDDSMLRNQVIKVNNNINDYVVDKLSVVLNARLVGLTIEDINLEVVNSLKEDLEGHEDLFSALITEIYSTLKKMDGTKVYTQGAVNMLNYPEFRDVDKAHKFLNFVENEKNLKELLTLQEGSIEHDDVIVSIGCENFMEDAKDYTVIKAEYKLDDRALGTIGVIGPRRMDYDKVVTLLNKMVQEINGRIHTKYIESKE